MNVLSLFKPIRAFVFDVDGVLTDGTLLLMPDGEMIRRMNIKDGYALQLAVKKGYHVVIISGGDSNLVKERLHKLGITEVHMKVTDKQQLLQRYTTTHGLAANEVLYMGDDIPDYEVMTTVGLPCAPADACAEIKSISQYISPARGGEGCARDVIEKVLKLNDHWTHQIEVTSK
jgi:3-deoxy-D-manno-octulosonate 8-phosphate phosphatase (KDO 8-P phosphatase)